MAQNPENPRNFGHSGALPQTPSGYGGNYIVNNITHCAHKQPQSEDEFALMSQREENKETNCTSVLNEDFATANPHAAQNRPM